MDEANKKEYKGRERSTPYPGIDLDTAIVLIGNLKTALGKGPYSRQAIAQALGHKDITGPSARKIAALSHYGLLNRNGDAHTISKNAEDILHPLSDEGKKEAMVLAVKTPRIFSKLISQYQGQALPRMLDSVLIREGIASNVATEAALVFIRSLEQVGLLKNGVLSPIVNKNPFKNPFDDFSGTGTSEGTDPSDLISNQSLPEKPLLYSFNDSGDGWSITIKSTRRLTQDTKNKLAVIAESLESNDN